MRACGLISFVFLACLSFPECFAEVADKSAQSWIPVDSVNVSHLGFAWQRQKPGGPAVRAIACSPEGDYCIVVHDWGAIRWDWWRYQAKNLGPRSPVAPAPGWELRTDQGKPLEETFDLGIGPGKFNGCAITGDARYVVSGRSDGTFVLAELVKGKKVRSFGSAREQQQNYVTALGCSPDATRIL